MSYLFKSSPSYLANLCYFHAQRLDECDSHGGVGCTNIYHPRRFLWYTFYCIRYDTMLTKSWCSYCSKRITGPCYYFILQVKKSAASLRGQSWWRWSHQWLSSSPLPSAYIFLYSFRNNAYKKLVFILFEAYRGALLLLHISKLIKCS